MNVAPFKVNLVPEVLMKPVAAGGAGVVPDVELVITVVVEVEVEETVVVELAVKHWK